MQLATYKYHLIDSICQKIGVVTKNGANFKMVRELLELEYPTLFWTPCAIYFIELTMINIGKFNIVVKKDSENEIIVYKIQRINEELY